MSKCEINSNWPFFFALRLLLKAVACSARGELLNMAVIVNSFYLFGPDLHGRCFLASVPIRLIDQLIGLRFEDKNQELPAGCGCQLKTRPGAGGARSQHDLSCYR